MSADSMSIITFALSVIGLWIGGLNPKWGWVYGIGCQLPWAIFGVISHARGVIALSVVMVGFYARNLWRWRHTPMPQVRRRPVPAQRSSSRPVAKLIPRSRRGSGSGGPAGCRCTCTCGPAADRDNAPAAAA